MAKSKGYGFRKTDDSFLESLGTDKSEFEFVETQDKLTQLAAQYSVMLANKLKAKDIASSGALGDSIRPLSIEVKGNIYSVEIVAKNYASYIDEGVDGWKESRGSRFKFKTKGVDPESAMVKNILKWKKFEKRKARDKYKDTTEREKKAPKDVRLQAAVTTAYMIKRMGVKPTHFWRDATNEFKVILEKELGMAVKIDIINNFN